MNRDDIIKMAESCGIPEYENNESQADNIVSFFYMVQAAEREACHALRQTLPNPHKHCQVSSHAYDMAITAYGAAIRARGNQ